MGRKIGPLCDAILNAIADGVEILEYSVYKPNALMRYGYPFIKEIEFERERAKMRAAMFRLKKRRAIIETKKRRQRSFQLSLLGEKIINAKKQLTPPELPNNRITIVSFDIPETERKARQIFRRSLKAAGFIKLHDSCWISTKAWAPLLANLIEESDLGDWVSVLEGRKIKKSQSPFRHPASTGLGLGFANFNNLAGSFRH
ncbi:hypothetical protein KKF59_02075 [Patescibacteria group bacterium]|nr:hypothetical protein [Patescibacteria group bacterium]MBU1035043.1 hypothetical protein [Patescibacteria group bacterium]MBU1630089.1 hypothetical protein [Patescibacteria group bacterium]MBU1907897.1 hypothetical protein [Patescibacteria group bacterium]